MPTLREEAEYLRLTLAMGLLDKAEAIAWADRTIISLDAPPIEIIDVSLAVNQPTDEIISLLSAVPGGGNFTSAAHRVLALWLDRILNGELTVRSAIKMLRTYSDWAEVPEAESHEARYFTNYNFQDEIEDEPLESAHEAFRDFFNRYILDLI